MSKASHGTLHAASREKLSAWVVCTLQASCRGGLGDCAVQCVPHNVLLHLCGAACRRAKAAWEAYYAEQLDVLKQASH